MSLQKLAKHQKCSSVAFFPAPFYTFYKRFNFLYLKDFSVISTSDFKKGRKILFRNEPYMVLEFMHVKPGKGPAYVRTKMKNMITGLTHEELFSSGEKFEDPGLEYKDMQYLYNDETLYHFMDLDSFEQVSLNKDQIEEALDYLKEQAVYNALYFKGKLIAISAPMFMELKVTDAPPGIRGNTAQGGATKPVTLETGFVVQDPLFVEEGDILKIDIRSGEYIERTK
jgi:elongation factor P